MRWLMTLIIFVPSLAWSQPDDNLNEDEVRKAESGQNVGYEAGFFLGNLLPNQIGGVTEITGLGGARGGYKVGRNAFAEAAVYTGNGSGAEWKSTSLSLRMDIPVETLVGMAYLGPDLVYYQGAGSTSSKLIFGGHVGGGIQALIGGATWFRADMKFGFSPGTSLFISFGFVFRMPNGSGGGAE